ncbi:aldehyde dehydrogenase family protein [Actinopolymorpha pittospori]|uniref:Acyl-CoA reductase-like NAD-dependent aldehyde dehydrogenase n=1 Tax=Actinopolymorpha pittospori TaxID=648752 RepID=A0A927MMU8_9ACTN|nr:acyl-CoA reductase-like NAD-dependent aldehyde dehydrogenase [Actinopolymorpha pittospori]
MTDQGLFIDGSWSDRAERTPQYDTWTREQIGTVAVGTAADTTKAVDAAYRAMRTPWPVHARAEALRRAAGLVAERAESFAQLITAEVGKPITAARGEVARAVETLRWSAEEAKRLPGERVPLDAVASGEGTFAFTQPVAKGVVAAITPFNFPINLLLHKLGPALAAGCAVVVKPSDHAPLTAGLMVRVFEEAGVPAGWLNLVTGPPPEIVGALQADDRVAVVTFTGSGRVGWALKAQAPRKDYVLELGSNTAMVVAADADIARAARAAADASFVYAGQACVSLQRLYVDRAVAEEFVAALTDIVRAMPVGDPRLESTVVGPLISADATKRLESWIDSAKQSGARILTGGAVADGLLPPTILTDVPADHPLVCEEAFGPVLSVLTVDGLADAIAQVNAADYALNTSIYTSDIATAMKYANEAEAGTVLINMPPSYRADHMPYGGVKGSGQGLEGVRYAIADLVREKLLVLHA